MGTAALDPLLSHGKILLRLRFDYGKKDLAEWLNETDRSSDHRKSPTQNFDRMQSTSN